MTTLNQQLYAIRQKVEKLGELNQQLSARNSMLEKELESLRTELEQQKNVGKDLEEKNKITKIAGVVSLNTQDKREIKLKINEFIREIDRCIALLND